MNFERKDSDVIGKIARNMFLQCFTFCS